MKPPLEHIRLTEQAKDQLTKLKRATGIKNWNALCRWAFCLSLNDLSRPLPQDTKNDSNIEMTWRVFAGEDASIYEALFALRCRQDGISLQDTHAIASEFRLHLHRGIAILTTVRDMTGVGQLIGRLVR